MTNWRYFLIGLWRRRDREEYQQIKESGRKSIELSKQARKEAEERIEILRAEMDGCGDDWFRGPLKPLDECGPNGLNGENQ